MATSPHQSPSPLSKLDDWDDFLEGRYKEGKAQAEFRQYDATADPGVAEFYRINHEKQTVAYALVQVNGDTQYEPDETFFRLAFLFTQSLAANRREAYPPKLSPNPVCTFVIVDCP